MVVKGVKFNCLQINLQHASAASAASSQRFVRYNNKIGLVQEPYSIKMGDEYKVSGISCGTFVYYNKTRPRACLVFGMDVQYTPLSSFVTQDLVAAIQQLQQLDLE